MIWLLFFFPSEPIEIQSNAGSYTLIIHAPTWQVNQPHTFELELKSPPEGDIDVFIDGSMPDHRHGLAVPAQIKKVGKYRWKVENLVLHMPGYWEIYFDMERNGEVERAQIEVVLQP